MNKSKLERIKLLCEREGLICKEVNGVVTIEEKKELPEKWEELGIIEGYWVDRDSVEKNTKNRLCDSENRNIFKTEEQAKASIALAQLSQLREVYRDGWKPNWKDGIQKWGIGMVNDQIDLDYYDSHNAFLSFQSQEIAELFLKNFKDLIEEAAPLLFGE